MGPSVGVPLAKAPHTSIRPLSGAPLLAPSEALAKQRLPRTIRVANSGFEPWRLRDLGSGGIKTSSYRTSRQEASTLQYVTKAAKLPPSGTKVNYSFAERHTQRVVHGNMAISRPAVLLC
jgi:hypothetical protein